MSDNIIQLNENLIKTELKSLVKQSVEDTLNTLLDQEAAELTNAAKYERSNHRAMAIGLVIIAATSRLQLEPFL